MGRLQIEICPTTKQGLLISPALNQDDTEREGHHHREWAESLGLMALIAPFQSGLEMMGKRLEPFARGPTGKSLCWLKWHVGGSELVAGLIGDWAAVPSLCALSCFSLWSPWRGAYHSSLLLKGWTPSQCRYQLGMPSCRTRRPLRCTVSACVPAPFLAPLAWPPQAQVR